MGTRWRVIGAPLLVAALIAGCSDGGDDDEVGAPERTGEQVERGDAGAVLVQATPQASDGSRIVVDTVVVTDGPGYLVIYSDGDGAPGQQLGVSEWLDAGKHEDVVVELEEPLEETAVVHAMVHLEDNGNDSFDFPDADQPATLDDGIVVVPLEIEVDR
jgi:hypothetical protein